MDSALSYEDTFGLPLLMISCEDKPLPLESMYGDTELADMRDHTNMSLAYSYFCRVPLSEPLVRFLCRSSWYEKEAIVMRSGQRSGYCLAVFGYGGVAS